MSLHWLIQLTKLDFELKTSFFRVSNVTSEKEKKKALCFMKKSLPKGKQIWFVWI
jgi:hypothetical protein